MKIISGISGRARHFLNGLRPKPSRGPQPHPGILRGPRLAALIAIAVLVAAASGAAFTESYHGLYEWAGEHGLSGFWQAAFPVQVDVFIAVGELALFVALIDGWRKRDRLGAWLVTLAGVAVSVAGNVGHIAGHRLTDRGTAAVPPLAAAAALAVGLGVLKRVVAARGRQVVTAAEEPQAGKFPSPVPGSAEAAAEASMRATAAAGNPWKPYALQTQFGLSRRAASEIHGRVLGELTPEPSLNGDGTHG